MNVDTRQWVIRLFAMTTAIICAAIAGVLIIRVAIDGNAPLTEQITAGFVSMLPQLLGFLAAVIVGEPAVSAVLAKITGSGPATATATAQLVAVPLLNSAPDSTLAGQPGAQPAQPGNSVTSS